MPQGTDLFIKLTKDVSGISLNSSKRSLIYNRIRRRLNELNVDIHAYTEICHNDASEMQYLLDLITTNHTSWFREAPHFDDIVKRVIPAILQSTSGVPKIRIWSAACSSGEEPYSLCIRILEAFPDSINWDLRILASDISQKIISTARAGIYNENDLKPLSANQKRIGFTALAPGKGEHLYQVNATLKKWVSFAQVNLISDWRMKGPFDIILCRNVMIYFDDQTRESIANHFSQLMRPGSVLYIGHTESLNTLQHPFTLYTPSVYELS